METENRLDIMATAITPNDIAARIRDLADQVSKGADREAIARDMKTFADEVPGSTKRVQVSITREWKWDRGQIMAALEASVATRPDLTILTFWKELTQADLERAFRCFSLDAEFEWVSPEFPGFDKEKGVLCLQAVVSVPRVLFIRMEENGSLERHEDSHGILREILSAWGVSFSGSVCLVGECE